MKALKIGLIVIASLVVVMFIFLVAYKILYSQGIAPSFEVNRPDLKQKVLIITQGSKFKDALVSHLIEQLKQKPVYIKVIDATALSGVKEEDWNAVVLINTCEMGKLQPDVKNYLTQAKNFNKVVLLTTSGSGDWKPKDVAVDSISSASKKEHVPSLSANILARLEKIL